MVEQKLKRSLSLPILTLYGLGNILGAGIYVLIGKVAEHSGVNTIPAFLIAMVIAALTAMSYMELSSRYPFSASASIYLYEAFKNRVLSIIVGLSLVIGGIASAAVLSKGFAGYLNSIVHVNQALASVILLILLGFIAIKGIGESAKLAAFLTIIETLGLIIIIWAGHSHITGGGFVSSFRIDSNVGISGVLFGAFLAFYAFIGFEDMVNVSEEVKKPRTTMPLAIMLSLITATILYIFVVIVSLSSIGADELANSGAPLNLVLDKVSHMNPIYISAIGIAATVNGVLVQIIMGSRILYGLSTQGWLHKRLSKVHPAYRTPVLSTSIVTALMIIGVISLGLVSLAETASLFLLIAFTLVNLALVIIKRQRKPSESSISFPIIVPILGALSCGGLIFFQLISR